MKQAERHELPTRQNLLIKYITALTFSMNFQVSTSSFLGNLKDPTLREKSQIKLHPLEYHAQLVPSSKNDIVSKFVGKNVRKICAFRILHLPVPTISIFHANYLLLKMSKNSPCFFILILKRFTRCQAKAARLQRGPPPLPAALTAQLLSILCLAIRFGVMQGKSHGPPKRGLRCARWLINIDAALYGLLLSQTAIP